MVGPAITSSIEIKNTMKQSNQKVLPQEERRVLVIRFKISDKEVLQSTWFLHKS